MPNLLNNTWSITPRGEKPSECTILSAKGQPLAFWQFQHGTLAGAEDTNGVTIEDLILITIDRLSALNAEPYKCKENQEALDHLIAAHAWLEARTDARVARGVEGTPTP